MVKKSHPLVGALESSGYTGESIAGCQKKFALKIVPYNLSKYFMEQHQKTTFSYPDRATTIQKEKCEAHLWRYCSEVLQDALMNVTAQRTVWDANTKVVLTAFQEKLGCVMAVKFKKACVNMAFAQGNEHGRWTTPECFDITPL